jgi:hypothetical protein
MSDCTNANGSVVDGTPEGVACSLSTGPLGQGGGALQPSAAHLTDDLTASIRPALAAMADMPTG